VSICSSHDGLYWQAAVLIDDYVCMVAGHGALVAKEFTHFLKVVNCELCRGDFMEGEAVT
jgi:hypothetical protein